MSENNINVPDHILDVLARGIVEGLDAFYANPENEAKFQAWRAAKYAKEGAHD